MRPTIAVLGTGGTIASTDASDGAGPSMKSDELVAAVPGLDDHANLLVREVVQRPSFSMDFPTLRQLRDAVGDVVADGADGVIVTHGTDTMEESAYHLDLVLGVDVPVVFTGAQRRPDELGNDGPSNLSTAVRAVTDDRIRSVGGVYIAFDEALYAARYVTKRHTRKLDTFVSPERGPVAVVTRDAVRLYRDPGSASVDLDVAESDAEVRVVGSAIGVSSAQVDEALEAGVDGLVLEGTGLGNVTAALGDAVARAVDAGVPVVVTSRCFAGSTAAVYGTAGGGQALASHGAVHGDDLPAHKARLKLRLVLALVDDPSEVGEWFV